MEGVSRLASYDMQSDSRQTIATFSRVNKNHATKMKRDSGGALSRQTQSEKCALRQKLR